MDRCKHDFLLDQCAECRDSGGLPRHVVVTSAGNVFHKRADCRALVDGQAKARSRGRDPAPPGMVPLTEAQGRGLGECLVCFHGADPWFWQEQSAERGVTGWRF